MLIQSQFVAYAAVLSYASILECGIVHCSLAFQTIRLLVSLWIYILLRLLAVRTLKFIR